MAVIEIDQLKASGNAHGQGASSQILRLIAVSIAGLLVKGWVDHFASDNFALLFPGKSSGETLKILDLVMHRWDQVDKRRDRPTGTDSMPEELPVISASRLRLDTTPTSPQTS